jgi:hypothetical protein
MGAVELLLSVCFAALAAAISVTLALVYPWEEWFARGLYLLAAALLIGAFFVWLASDNAKPLASRSRQWSLGIIVSICSIIIIFGGLWWAHARESAIPSHAPDKSALMEFGAPHIQQNNQGQLVFCVAFVSKGALPAIGVAAGVKLLLPWGPLPEIEERRGFSEVDAVLRNLESSPEGNEITNGQQMKLCQPISQMERDNFLAGSMYMYVFLDGKYKGAELPGGMHYQTVSCSIYQQTFKKWTRCQFIVSRSFVAPD